MTEARRTLPQRRPAFTFDMVGENGRTEMTVSFSVFEPSYEVAEVFITSRKIGSDAEAICRDAAILLSLCLQHGCPFEVIRGALTRNADGSPQSMMGKVADRVMEETQR